MEVTKQVNEIGISKAHYENAVCSEICNIIRKHYIQFENDFFNTEWIKFSINSCVGYWNSKTEIAIPVLANYNAYRDNFFESKREFITLDEVKTLFTSNCPSEIINGIKASTSYSGDFYIGYGPNSSYSLNGHQEKIWNDKDSVKVSFFKIHSDVFKNNTFKGIYNISNYEQFYNLISIVNSTNVNEACIEDLDRIRDILGLDRDKLKEEAEASLKKNKSEHSDFADIYIKKLLDCDKSRADIESYSKKCIGDINMGHWELWSDSELKSNEDRVVVQLDKPLIARNPLADIHNDGLIGIDFGTKSTIISRQDGKNKTTLMRIGIGQLAKEAESYHFENPTIMEFRNLLKFIEDYNCKSGRPETSIEDIRVSHTANKDLDESCNSDDFYSFFYDIKQWCGDTERKVKVLDQIGVEKVLPPFLDVEDDFNPLEFYAYYLGLYINNMHNGIYLDYIMSFPVTYEKNVKEKILDSFKKGLKKSLPEAVLNDEKAMAKFRVSQGVSEPAAYAITALQGYGFEPEEDENILYSIFDFGGGTTDFDFGLWRLSDDSSREEELYDYVIEHFGSEGDKYLGGENLLELLAYEVFKANTKLLAKGRKSDNDADIQASAGFSFSKPKECDAFTGSETFISNSQEARRNTKQLMEVLRPFWEGIIDIENENNDYSNDKDVVHYNGYIFKNNEICKFPINDGAVEVDLFDKDGNRKQKQKLYIESQELGININLTEILENRIRRGVESFFNSVMLAFRNENAVKSGVDGIQIFLAGNSSKSPVLRKLFNEYIEKSNSEINQNYEEGYFHLYPPLGTEEANEIQKEKGVKVNDDISAPTGKTGVAYGIIAGRPGGKIKVVSEVKADDQTKFRYNIGIEKRGKFLVKLDRNVAEYGKWIRFISAAQEDFELFYTSLPAASKTDIDETGIYKKRCRLQTSNPDADIYIRCVSDSPEDIEYCVSVEEPTENEEIIRIHLSE